MRQRLPLFIRHTVYNLRGGFLIRPLLIALTLGSSGAFLSLVEEHHPQLSSWLPAALFPSRSDPQVAQMVLGDIATSIMTVVSIIFAILLMTLTLASMQFSPRIISSFVKDKVTQWALGLFLGTFAYCIAALPAARTLPHPFSPILTTFGAMILALICIGWLLFFIHHISQAISVSHIVDKVAVETNRVVAQTMPEPYLGGELGITQVHELDAGATPIASERSGYIRYIDLNHLREHANHAKVKLRVLRKVGYFVPKGVPLLLVSKVEKLTDHQRRELLSAFDLGPSRTLQQDIEFGILQIVDIALRAISPAVNDPTTAINCIDQLSGILIQVAGRKAPSTVLYDPPSIPRILVSWPTFGELLESAFGQIRHYSQSDVAVSLRLLRGLIDIATAVERPDIRHHLLVLGTQVVEGCAPHMAANDLNRVQDRWSDLEKRCK
ncbi:MAG: DUF2254 domain-containing protein [Burkholderiales bacterium]|nr:DUF2254 domain-containing protein [Burkholderiales bacterium]